MADHLHHKEIIRVVEQCQVSAPSGSVPSTCLPLTFYDIPWIPCHPIQRIFFYDSPHPTHHFLHTLLPTLKHSLSLTLQHFFPFAANLVVPPQYHLHHPYILYHESDSIPFTVAESTADFNRLISHSPKNVSDLHPFVPALPPPRTSEDGTRFVPLMAIQLTLVPNSGFCICVTYAHVAADGAALHHFMKFWGSVCKAGGDLNSLGPSLPLPCHNRELVHDPKGIKLVYLEFLKDLVWEPRESLHVDKVRATFVLSRDQIEKLKKWRGQLVGENGFMEAVNCIESGVRDVKSDVLGGAETFFSRFLIKVATSSEPLVGIAGSPKLSVYETDFGWGKPKQSDVVHIDSSDFVSLSDSSEGGSHRQCSNEWLALPSLPILGATVAVRTRGLKTPASARVVMA
ncbi:coumaroyl-CoA:anthocyanidin 3-O-glucoside-6''-O-coumaroyltransferase 1-like [Senna tora]|uniref:Coumaroyl-CoA:anthocyanidin 3-O-glucoside-6''-O-coumaroyltransferase 1-like n=1 Tax=Senna tora TaxID=362788 RepID=A0A834XHS0_9FABA|nr:coumaroyl-CoA:anthocyanidin 3-O-glucoside-6''-O-coumaroyltransferase 1-like [Senna tora]